MKKTFLFVTLFFLYCSTVQADSLQSSLDLTGTWRLEYEWSDYPHVLSTDINIVEKGIILVVIVYDSDLDEYSFAIGSHVGRRVTWKYTGGGARYEGMIEDKDHMAGMMYCTTDTCQGTWSAERYGE
jgi:hypothetical protein